MAALPLGIFALHPHLAESQPTQHHPETAISVDNARLLGLHPLHRPDRQVAGKASRSERREPLPQPTDAYPAGSTRAIGQLMAAKQGWAGAQWQCLDALWTRESNWRTTARNSSSGAYGIPQALPGEKMAQAGADWPTNPVTQIAWGLGYIANRYGTPCAALEHSNETGFY